MEVWSSVSAAYDCALLRRSRAQTSSHSYDSSCTRWREQRSPSRFPKVSHAPCLSRTAFASHTIPEHISAPDLPFLSVDRPDLFMPDLRIAQVEASEPKRVLDAMYEGEL